MQSHCHSMGWMTADQTDAVAGLMSISRCQKVDNARLKALWNLNLLHMELIGRVAHSQDRPPHLKWMLETMDIRRQSLNSSSGDEKEGEVCRVWRSLRMVIACVGDKGSLLSVSTGVYSYKQLSIASLQRGTPAECLRQHKQTTVGERPRGGYIWWTYSEISLQNQQM